MRNATRGKIMRGTAVFIDTAAPLIATATQFPIWVDRSSEATVSGCFIFLAFLSCIPFIRQIKEYMKSPAAVVLWGVFLALFVALQNIIAEMVVVCFVGVCANGVGAILYKIGNVVGEKPDKTTDAPVAPATDPNAQAT